MQAALLKKKKKRATSSSIWSVWTECFIYPHEHAVRRACPRHNVNFRSCFFFFFFVAYFLRKFTLYYFIFSVSLCQSECRLKSKPHDGDREKKKKKSQSVEWLPLKSCRALHRHRQLHMATGGEKNNAAIVVPCEEKKTGMQEISEPSRVFLSPNIPVGYQMMWDEFCNNCSVGNSGQMSLELKGKQSLFFFYF